MQSFSKTSLCDLNEVEENNDGHTLPSVRSPSVCSPIRRLKLLRERLLCDLNDFEPTFEINCPSQTPTSPKCDEFRLTECHPASPSYRIDSHPCDLFYSPSCDTREYIPKQRSARQETISTNSPFMHGTVPDDSVLEPKTPPSTKRKITRRAKSCPKNMFSPTKHYLNWNAPEQQAPHQALRDNPTPCTISTVSTRDVRSIKPKHRKPKIKTSNTMDAYLSSKLVRSNLAANLRQNWSRQKIHSMAEEKLKATMHVSNFIPKCHQWNVHTKPAWKSFACEE